MVAPVRVKKNWTGPDVQKLVIAVVDYFPTPKQFNITTYIKAI
jgi:hypothetical protein